jgi:6-pyruvoyl-tetrahydropterin synthase
MERESYRLRNFLHGHAFRVAVKTALEAEALKAFAFFLR